MGHFKEQVDFADSDLNLKAIGHEVQMEPLGLNVEMAVVAVD